MKQILRITALSLVLTGCATAPEPVTDEAGAAESAVLANDYPTRDRVDYVLECIAKHGGLSYINQYACGCKIDKIAEQLSFAEYESARTFVQMQKTPGEAGSAFRDPKHGKDLRKQLKEADAAAEKACFVK
ncbi:hypothetical protein [Methylomonas methanica]|uniref:Lipoprotein n=1 Tax=Methylomonas methanica (strain DSM 25384 / MC09) TaxID=857087 RepID=G0A2I9_METMM|nr:hypothetical protein [Methylomonas methanica]AEG00169.1 hypothetical protein Metme_1751 [Methylomonas methanica MC09]